MVSGSGGSCRDGSWGQVPTGCSAQSGGDWAAHLKTGPTDNGPGCVHEAYQLVCTAPQERYSFLDRACVSGSNIQVLPGLSVDACAEICDADSDCLAFEYGVEYPGLSGHDVGDCRPQSASTVVRPCHFADFPQNNLDLYIKPSQTSNTPAGYRYHDRACISGANLVHLYAEGVSVARCAEICDATQQCLAFEYGVDYPGRSGVDLGDCRPQSGTTVNNGCSSWNLDLYVKPDVPYGYVHHERACVSGANLGHLYASGVTAHHCAALCNANDDCVSFEYGVDYAGLSGADAGDCRPQSSSTVLSPCASWNLDLYIKPSPDGNPAWYQHGSPLMPQPAWQPACPDPNFPFQHSDGLPYCYNDRPRTTGPCSSWCTTDFFGNGGCGSNADKMCNVPCFDPGYPYPYSQLVQGQQYCASNAAIAAASTAAGYGCPGFCAPDPASNLWNCVTHAAGMCR